MLTPRFELKQDDEFVYITVFISNVRFSAAAIEMVVNDEVFVFSLPPYYLRLRFPKPLVETEDATSQFVPKEECIKIRIPKLNKGEFFPDLDIGAKLLARLNEPTTDSKQTKQMPLIEEVDSSSSDRITAQHYSSMEQEAMQYDWEIPQTLQTPLTDLKQSVSYGFNNQYSDYLTVSLANGNDLNELSDPDHLQPDDRIMERLIRENIKFDMEYYANDYINVKYLQEEGDQGLISALKFVSPFNKLFNDSSSKNDIVIEFNKDENDQMIGLPKKSYLVDDSRPLYYTILCVLYAYSYELRSFAGETTIESVWTIVLLDDLCAWILRDDGCNDLVLRNLAHALRKEVENLSKKDIVFEKIIQDDEPHTEDGDEEKDSFSFLNLLDVEELADEAYISNTSHN
ncbi:hypothetical protein CANINC_002937 [Pichia inconspicua]|uniref:CS domain-containing protein n=1 Tax=Pichia inconspicua TaxID=52247 RepID=A0A4T0WZT9_9ASCO|nr:hypothetical protein CANINC_002937 [[Candida] inconspicua]